MSCPFKNALGIPGEGVHSYRIFGLAAFDIIATIIVAIISSYYTKTSFALNFLVWFILGEVLHYIFCVETAFLKLIFL